MRPPDQLSWCDKWFRVLAIAIRPRLFAAGGVGLQANIRGATSVDETPRRIDFTGATAIETLFQFIYTSQPFGYDTPTLTGILLDARNNNQRDDITGALVCRHDIYLQLLEGPEQKVRAAVERIGRDDRHVGMQALLSEPVSERMFGNWAMLHDPATSWIWTEAELSDGILDRASPQEIRSMFSTLSAKAANDSLE